MNLPVVVPFWLRLLYPRRTWSYKEIEKTLYLSFDDGPHPVITPKVLELLRHFNAKATFFCLGKNVSSPPEIFERIKADGHSIGNHSYHHVNGWKASNASYLEDVMHANELIKSPLYRPPYGRLKFSQASLLRKMGYQLIMWTLLSADYDQRLSKEDCYQRIWKHLHPGAIVLFHDSEKAADNMLYALERLLKEASKVGYQFKAIEHKKGSA